MCAPSAMLRAELVLRRSLILVRAGLTAHVPTCLLNLS